MYKFDPVYGTVPVPNFSSNSIPEQVRRHPQVSGYDVYVSFNRWGYRGRDFDFIKSPGTYRIVTLGGSTTQNVEVSDVETWSARLEAKLKGDPEFLKRVGARTVEVINGGLGGSRTREGLLRFEQDVVRMQPALMPHCPTVGTTSTMARRGTTPISRWQRRGPGGMTSRFCRTSGSGR
jgi:hypothetical protein